MQYLGSSGAMKANLSNHLQCQCTLTRTRMVAETSKSVLMLKHPVEDLSAYTYVTVSRVHVTSN